VSTNYTKSRGGKGRKTSKRRNGEAQRESNAMRESRERERSANERDANARDTKARNISTARDASFVDDVPERVWQVAAGLIFLAALALRFVALELNPLHHDEGVNSFFLLRLMREGVYQYDPANYHGPTLYYFALPVALFFDKLMPGGVSVFALRFVPALFGLATVALIFTLRRRIGNLGALTAAALVAVSPGNVYISRYFIHETMFVFFTLGIVVAALRFYETARPVYLMFVAVCAALLFATKETAFISVGVILIAWAMTHFFFKWRGGAMDNRDDASAFDNFAERFGGAARIFTLLLIAAALFIVVYVLFYSSFGTHWKGVTDSLETFKIWSKTGSKDHTKPLTTYLAWLKDEEAALLAFAVIGACLAVWRGWRGRDSFALFTALWSFGLFAAYSLIAYKTPWLALNFIVPMAIIGGYGADVLCRQFRRQIVLRAALIVLIFAAIGFGLYQTVTLNFYHYDDDSYVYVYAHTQRDFLRLIKDIETYSERTEQKKEAPIAVDAPEYWPLPWYLREHKGVAYMGRVVTNAEPLVIVAQQDEQKFEAMNGAQYALVGVYNMRPGVILALYVRRNLVS
jgi:uncharacterized protein (TIGR03663 family)